MNVGRMWLALVLVGVIALIVQPRPFASAQDKGIKIGVLFDHTGPFPAAGSLNC